MRRMTWWLVIGSAFLSWNKPVWFAVRESGIGESENGLVKILGSGVEFDGVDVDVLDIDIVKEFYEKLMQNSMSNWFRIIFCDFPMQV
ncbi:mitotic apparatus protein p62-like [Fagus crenata]